MDEVRGEELGYKGGNDIEEENECLREGRADKIEGRGKDEDVEDIGSGK